MSGDTDAIDLVTHAKISFESTYDNSLTLWLTRKTTTSEPFSLNTQTRPAQWVQGDLPGACDFPHPPQLK